MHRIKELLLKELKEYENKGELKAGELEIVHKITDTIKNIDKIEMLEDGGYAHNGGRWGAVGSYEGAYVHGDKPDIQYDEDVSYARRKRDRMGKYARDGSKEYMTRKLDEMLDSAENDKQREAIHRCMKELERI